MSGFPLIGAIAAVLIVAVLIVLRNNKKKEAQSGAATISPAAETGPQAAPVETAVAVEDDADVVAVIAAAIAAMSKQAVVIKVITRIPGMQAPSWSLAGRQDTMSLRQQ